jgi:hypothetical protein
VEDRDFILRQAAKGSADRNARGRPDAVCQGAIHADRLAHFQVCKRNDCGSGCSATAKNIARLGIDRHRDLGADIRLHQLVAAQDIDRNTVASDGRDCAGDRKSAASTLLPLSGSRACADSRTVPIAISTAWAIPGSRCWDDHGKGEYQN